MKQKLFTAAAFLAAFAFLALALAAPLPLMERSDEVLYTQVMPRQLAADAPYRLYDFLGQMDFWSEEEQAELERQITQADSWRTMSDSVGFSVWRLYTPLRTGGWDDLEWELSSQGQLVRLRMGTIREYTEQELEHLMDEYLAATGLDALEDWQQAEVTRPIFMEEEGTAVLRARYSSGAKLYLYANYVNGTLVFGACPLEQEELTQLEVSLPEE